MPTTTTNVSIVMARSCSLCERKLISGGKLCSKKAEMFVKALRNCVSVWQFKTIFGPWKLEIRCVCVCVCVCANGLWRIRYQTDTLMAMSLPDCFQASYIALLCIYFVLYNASPTVAFFFLSDKPFAKARLVVYQSHREAYISIFGAKRQPWTWT